MLHDLHPDGVETRIQAALERVRPYLGSHAGGIDYLGVDDAGVAHLRLQGSCDSCPSSGETVRDAVERAVLEAAPEVERDRRRGRRGDGHDPGGLLQISTRRRSSTAARFPRPSRDRAGPAARPGSAETTRSACCGGCYNRTSVPRRASGATCAPSRSASGTATSPTSATGACCAPAGAATCCSPARARADSGCAPCPQEVPEHRGPGAARGAVARVRGSGRPAVRVPTERPHRRRATRPGGQLPQPGRGDRVRDPGAGLGDARRRRARPSARLADDVEAILLRRTAPGAFDCLVVPIDVCYELVGLVRPHWSGLPRRHRAVAAGSSEFFDGVASRVTGGQSDGDRARVRLHRRPARPRGGRPHHRAAAAPCRAHRQAGARAGAALPTAHRTGPPALRRHRGRRRARPVRRPLAVGGHAAADAAGPAEPGGPRLRGRDRRSTCCCPAATTSTSRPESTCTH